MGDEDAGELGEEEVGVCVDGVVEAGLAEGEEGGVLLRCGLLGVVSVWWRWRGVMGGGYGVFE